MNWDNVVSKNACQLKDPAIPFSIILQILIKRFYKILIDKNISYYSGNPFRKFHFKKMTTAHLSQNILKFGHLLIEDTKARLIYTIYQQ